jgi:hypothetical protein
MSNQITRWVFIAAISSGVVGALALTYLPAVSANNRLVQAAIDVPLFVVCCVVLMVVFIICPLRRDPKED